MYVNALIVCLTIVGASASAKDAEFADYLSYRTPAEMQTLRDLQADLSNESAVIISFEDGPEHRFNWTEANGGVPTEIFVFDNPIAQVFKSPHELNIEVHGPVMFIKAADFSEGYVSVIDADGEIVHVGDTSWLEALEIN